MNFLPPWPSASSQAQSNEPTDCGLNPDTMGQKKLSSFKVSVLGMLATVIVGHSDKQRTNTRSPLFFLFKDKSRYK